MNEFVLNENDKMEILKLFYNKNSNYEGSGNLKKELIKHKYYFILMIRNCEKLLNS